jgi:hypothetical protein
MKMKHQLRIVVIAMLAVFATHASAYALAVNMRPSAGQPAPSSITQSDGSVVTPDANGNFLLTQPLTIQQELAQGWIMSLPAGSVNILGNVTAGTVNADLSKGCFVTETLTGNITQTFSNAAYCKSKHVCIEPTQDGTGGRSITWSGFTGLTPAQPAQAPGAVDLFCFGDDGVHLVYPPAGENQTAASLTLDGSTSGALAIQAAAATTSYTLTMPATAPTTSGQVLSATTAGAASWIAEPGSISWDGALGGYTATAVKPTVAPCAGHFTQLACTAVLTGACTTGPTINVGDVTAATSGTAVAPTTTVATIAKQAQTLTFAAGDTIALEQTATTSSCTAPIYGCTAQYTCP